MKLGPAKHWLLLGGLALLGVGACGGSDSGDATTPTGAAGAAAGSGGSAAGAGGVAAGTGGATAGAAGTSAGAAGAATVPSQELIDACKARHTAKCTKLGECAPGMLAALGGMDECVSRYSSLCVASVNVPGANTGPEELNACTPKLASLSCDDFIRHFYGNEFDPCDLPRGTRADGEPCVAPGQCQGGACLLTSPLGCGTCAKAMKPGEACSASAPCDGGYCGGAKVCVPFGKTGDVCSANKPCQANLLCTSGACGPKHQLGEDCLPAQNPLAGCGYGNHCNTMTSKCEGFSFVDAGAGCGSTPAGGWAACKASSACKLSGNGNAGSCVPIAPKGADCAGSFWQDPCEAGMVCDQICGFPNPGSCG